MTRFVHLKPPRARVSSLQISIKKLRTILCLCFEKESTNLPFCSGTFDLYFSYSYEGLVPVDSVLVENVDFWYCHKLHSPIVSSQASVVQFYCGIVLTSTIYSTLHYCCSCWWQTQWVQPTVECHGYTSRHMVRLCQACSFLNLNGRQP